MRGMPCDQVRPWALLQVAGVYLCLCCIHLCCAQTPTITKAPVSAVLAGLPKIAKNLWLAGRTRPWRSWTIPSCAKKMPNWSSAWPHLTARLRSLQSTATASLQQQRLQLATGQDPPGEHCLPLGVVLPSWPDGVCEMSCKCAPCKLKSGWAPMALHTIFIVTEQVGARCRTRCRLPGNCTTQDHDNEIT